jgi:hypothetical protein
MWWRPVSPRGSRGIALGISVAVHSLLLLAVIEGRPPDVPGRRLPLLIIPPEPDYPHTAPTIIYTPRTDQGRGILREPVRGGNPIPDDTLPPTAPRMESLPGPEDPVTIPRSPAAWLGASLGDGRLWVRPLPLPPRALADRLEPTHLEKIDSVVTAIVQRYLDSIAAEPGADQVPLPDWTTEVEGLKFGLDSRNIYIAGLRIPSVVLALLPIPATGDQSKALDKSGAWIAEDIRRAASRAADLDDFKEAIRELRERKQWEKDLERAQREGADSSETGKAAQP